MSGADRSESPDSPFRAGFAWPHVDGRRMPGFGFYCPVCKDTGFYSVVFAADPLHSLLCLMSPGGLISSGHGSGRDGEPVPRVDGGYCEGKIRELLLAEMRAHLFIHRVGHMSVRDQSKGFGPGQGGAFAVGVERAFAPGIQRVEPLLALTDGAQIFPVHVDAVGAAVDLRGAQLDEMEQGLLQ